MAFSQSALEDGMNTAIINSVPLNESELEALASELGRLHQMWTPAIPFGWEKGKTGYLYQSLNMGDEAVGAIAYILGLRVRDALLALKTNGVTVGERTKEQATDANYEPPGDMDRATRDFESALGTLNWLQTCCKGVNASVITAQVMRAMGQLKSDPDPKNRVTEEFYNELVDELSHHLLTVEGGEVIIYPGYVRSWSNRVAKLASDLMSVRDRLQKMEHNDLVTKCYMAKPRTTPKALLRSVEEAVETAMNADIDIEDPLRERTTDVFVHEDGTTTH